MNDFRPQNYPLESPKQILIVGGGLAGTLMAAESMRAGHEVVLVDEEKSNSATQIAAGLYNIITGRMATKTWRAEELLSSLSTFFSDPLFHSLRPFLHPIPIYRPYKSISERNTWFLRSAESGYAPFTRHVSSPRDVDRIHNTLGGLEILPCGWLEAGAFVSALKDEMVGTGKMKWIRKGFEYSALDPKQMCVDLWGEKRKFDEVIFAEGAGLRHNPFFKWVDLRPLKGQVLEIELEGLPEGYILLRKVYLVPRGAHRYVVGSTYEKNFTDLNPTNEGVSALEQYVAEATPLPFKVLEARAGARPTTPNRRPILGRHPEFPGICIFNGLGTKGVLQGPWCARMFRNWLDGKLSELPPEVRLERFR